MVSLGSHGFYGICTDIFEILFEDIPENLFEGLVEDLSENIFEDLAEDLPENLLENLSEDIPGNLCEDLSESLFENFFGDLPAGRGMYEGCFGGSPVRALLEGVGARSWQRRWVCIRPPSSVGRAQGP